MNMSTTVMGSLAQHIAQRAADGAPTEELVAELMARRGDAKHIAQRLVTAILADGVRGQTISSQPRGAELAVPTPVFTRPGVYEFEGRSVTLAWRNLIPEAYFFENLVSEDECRELIEYGSSRLQRGLMYDPEKKQYVEFHRRTSMSATVSNQDLPLGERLAQRLSRFFQWPRETLEAFDVQRYLPGQQFMSHVDWVPRAKLNADPPKSPTGGHGGPIATLVLYLNQPLQGGETAFENVGLEVLPKAGGGLFFSYPSMDAASMTMHAGRPVEQGEKWIATFFWWEDDRGL